MLRCLFHKQLKTTRCPPLPGVLSSPSARSLQVLQRRTLLPVPQPVDSYYHNDPKSSSANPPFYFPFPLWSPSISRAYMDDRVLQQPLQSADSTRATGRVGRGSGGSGTAPLRNINPCFACRTSRKKVLPKCTGLNGQGSDSFISASHLQRQATRVASTAG